MDSDTLASHHSLCDCEFNFLLVAAGALSSSLSVCASSPAVTARTVGSRVSASTPSSGSATCVPVPTRRSPMSTAVFLNPFVNFL